MCGGISMNNEELFRKLFVDFDIETKKKLKREEVISLLNKDKKIEPNLSDYIDALKVKRISPYYNEYDFISFCRWCRNRISHINDNEKYLIYTDDLINKFKMILDVVKHPYTVYSKSIKKIYSANINDNVKKVMKTMSDSNYTHVPIYDNDKLVGIFSEGALFNYLLDNNEINIDDKTIFNDIKEYIDITNSNELVEFVSKDMLYDDIINYFINKFNDGKKISCILITHNGKKHEKILGILTYWDIITK